MYSNIPATANEWFTFVASQDSESLPLNPELRRAELIARYLCSKGREDQVPLYTSTQPHSLGEQQLRRGNQP